MARDGVYSYPVTAERLYCSHPRYCIEPDVLIIGSAVGLYSARFLVDQFLRTAGRVPHIVVADAGPFDLMNHLGQSQGFKRVGFLQAGMERVGGKLVFWGLSAPRPPARLLAQWLYEPSDLDRRFSEVEQELGVPDPIPWSDQALERGLTARLGQGFPENVVRQAPLAIDRQGVRWTPLRYIPELVDVHGIQLLARFRCRELVTNGEEVLAVKGTWHDGSEWSLRPRFVVLAVGVEPSIPLLQPLCLQPTPLEAADHHRIDCHGSLLPGRCLPELHGLSGEEMGVAVLLVEGESSPGQTPYHLEVKVGPRCLWARGALPSADNLRCAAADTRLTVQVQAVAAMHDRLPAVDMLNVASSLPPVMSARDAVFHGELVAKLLQVARTTGVDEPTFTLRPLLENHHVIGAYRVGRAVTRDFRWRDCDNLYVLPPAAYVDCDDDANPTLKSLVLSQYAMEDIVRRLQEPADSREPHELDVVF